jgi:uncharacterized membrane protein YheB (UPF0754 family)
MIMSGPYQDYVLNAGLFALSGGITNWLAIHMLFERVPGFYGSGVIQLRFDEFKMGIRKLIMEQFFSKNQIGGVLDTAVDASEKIEDYLQKGVRELNLDEAFDSLIDVIMSSSFSSMISMIGGREALNPLKGPFIEKLREYFQSQFLNSNLLDNVTLALRAGFDEEEIHRKITFIIDQRLDQMTPRMVKEIVQEMIQKHLGWLVVWGCAFGGIIGLIVTITSN